MGEIKNFPKYKLIIGILTPFYNKNDDIITLLADNFGEIDYISRILDFNYTDYYNKELGENIKRFFVSFKELAAPDSLAKIKIAANKLEQLFSQEKEYAAQNNIGTASVQQANSAAAETHQPCRKINLDPGILNSSRLILASTKDNAHRIPLRNGIYSEVTLIFSKGKFAPLPWTYIDYQSAEYCEILLKIREIYKKNLINLKRQ